MCFILGGSTEPPKQPLDPPWTSIIIIFTTCIIIIIIIINITIITIIIIIIIFINSGEHNNLPDKQETKPWEMGIEILIIYSKI